MESQKAIPVFVKTGFSKAQIQQKCPPGDGDAVTPPLTRVLFCGNRDAPVPALRQPATDAVRSLVFATSADFRSGG